jgi:hypothetical protein
MRSLDLQVPRSLHVVFTHARNILVFITSGLSILLQEFRLDHSYMWFALPAATRFSFAHYW